MRRIEHAAAARRKIEPLGERRFANVARRRGTQAQIAKELEVQSRFPAIELAHARVVRRPIREAGTEVLPPGRLPNRHVDLAEHLPDVVAAGDGRNGRELMQVRAPGRERRCDAANAEVRRVEGRPQRVDLDGIGAIVERLLAIRDARGERQRSRAQAIGELAAHEQLRKVLLDDAVAPLRRRDVVRGRRRNLPVAHDVEWHTVADRVIEADRRRRPVRHRRPSSSSCPESRARRRAAPASGCSAARCR